MRTERTPHRGLKISDHRLKKWKTLHLMLIINDQHISDTREWNRGFWSNTNWTSKTSWHSQEGKWELIKKRKKKHKKFSNKIQTNPIKNTPIRLLSQSHEVILIYIEYLNQLFFHCWSFFIQLQAPRHVWRKERTRLNCNLWSRRFW